MHLQPAACNAHKANVYFIFHACKIIYYSPVCRGELLTTAIPDDQVTSLLQIDGEQVRPGMISGVV